MKNDALQKQMKNQTKYAKEVGGKHYAGMVKNDMNNQITILGMGGRWRWYFGNQYGESNKEERSYNKRQLL